MQTDNQERILKKKLEEAQMVADRLERLSADSVWAHQASGVRGGLLQVLTQSNKANTANDSTRNADGQIFAKFEILLTEGFMILEKAAREIPEEPDKD